MSEKMLKIGIVGAGHIANYHAKILRERVGNNQVVAVADPDEAAAKKLAEKVGQGCKAYADGVKLIQEADLDAVYLCVPPMAHGGYEKAAVERRLPMLIEKPITPNLQQAREIHAMLPADLPVSVAYNWRYMPSVEPVLELLKTNRPSGFVATWKEGIPPARWWRMVEQSGGPVIEQASHLLDLGMYYCGPIKAVQSVAVAHRPKDFGDIDDLVMAIFEFESGAIGQLIHTCLLNGRIHRIGYDVLCWGLEISGERDGSVAVRSKDGTRNYAGDYDQSYANESAAFLHAVRTGDTSRIRCDYVGGMESIALGEAIAKAARSGKRTEVEKI